MSAAPGCKEATSHPESGEGAPASSRAFARHHRGCPLCLFRRTMRRPSSACVQVLQRCGGVRSAAAGRSSPRRSCTRLPGSRDGAVKVGTARWRTVSLGVYRQQALPTNTCDDEKTAVFNNLPTFVLSLASSTCLKFFTFWGALTSQKAVSTQALVPQTASKLCKSGCKPEKSRALRTVVNGGCAAAPVFPCCIRDWWAFRNCSAEQ